MTSSHIRYFSFLSLTIALGTTTACQNGGTPRPTPEHPGVPYGEGENQWLNLYLADSDTPTPVYVFSHANGSTADDVSGFVDELKGVGISTVSWESVVLPDGSAEDIETGWSDAQLMLDWLKENADTYNLDTDKMIIGGRSRGSLFSWQLAHSQEPDIKGIYMFQALPDGVWQNTDSWTPTDEVTENSPPMKLTYKEAPGTTDGHKPEHGYTILDRYEELGIGNKAELTHSLEGEASLFYDIADWCTNLLEQ